MTQPTPPAAAMVTDHHQRYRGNAAQDALSAARSTAGVNISGQHDGERERNKDLAGQVQHRNHCDQNRGGPDAG